MPANFWSRTLGALEYQVSRNPVPILGLVQLDVQARRFDAEAGNGSRVTGLQDVVEDVEEILGGWCVVATVEAEGDVPQTVLRVGRSQHRKPSGRLVQRLRDGGFEIDPDPAMADQGAQTQEMIGDFPPLVALPGKQHADFF